MARRTTTKTIACCGILIALLVVSCLFTIPLGPVPFTLQTAVIILVALLLPPRLAALTCCTYLLMGAIGLPVFSGMTGGFGKFLGPTGGFLLAYAFSPALAAAARCALERRGVRQLACDASVVAIIVGVNDLLGWLWFMILTGSDPLSAFLVADAPFIVIDIAKGALAIGVAAAMRAGLNLQRGKALDA